MYNKMGDISNSSSVNRIKLLKEKRILSYYASSKWSSDIGNI